jgi:hypothetical protein
MKQASGSAITRPTILWGHDRVIRNERELDAVRKYIEANPRNWAEDEENIISGKYIGGYLQQLAAFHHSDNRYQNPIPA